MAVLERSQESRTERPSENLGKLGIDLAMLPDFSLLQENNAQAWNAVIHHVTGLFNRRLNSIAPDISQHDRADLLQEVLLRLHSEVPKLTGWLHFFRKVGIFTWRSTQTFLRNRNRQAQKISSSDKDFDDALARQVDDSSTPEEQLSQLEKEELADNILDQLPKEERRLYENYFICKSIEKLAEHEGIPHTTAQHKLNRIKNKVKLLLEEYEKS